MGGREGPNRCTDSVGLSGGIALGGGIDAAEYTRRAEEAPAMRGETYYDQEWLKLENSGYGSGPQ